MRGETHPRWKGDAANVTTGRERARRRFAADACVQCGATENLDRHHVDGNTRNNEPENVEVRCRRCHMSVDGRLHALAHATDLTPAQVETIGRRYAALPRASTRCKPGTVSALAAELGVSVKTINNVSSGRRAKRAAGGGP
jgi:hypothetical protein